MWGLKAGPRLREEAVDGPLVHRWSLVHPFTDIVD